MQFNPACLSGSGNMSTNTATMNTTSAEFANNPNTPNAYPDGPPQTANPWAQQSSVLGLPVYGIYNASLIPVPEAVPNQASDNAPAITKKKSAKRSPQPKSDNMVLDDSKAEDRFQGLDEEQKLKRQRRLIKNREAAQQFRQRQKEYIQNLERRVTELNSHVGETHKHIELLTAENRLLRDQLVYLYNVMRQNLSLTTTPSPLSPTASSPSAFTSAMSSSVPPSPSIPPTPPPSPISPFPSNMSLPASNMSAAINSPTQMLDLSMLGFKGYNMMSDGSISYEMLKTTATAQGMQNIPQNLPQGIPQHMNQNIPQNLTHNLTQNLAQNLQALQNIQNMNQSAQHLQQMTLSTPTSSAQNSPVPTPTSSPPHLSTIPDLGTLKLDMDNAMLLSRYGKANDPNEAQTVPVFVKSEGSASL